MEADGKFCGDQFVYDKLMSEFGKKVTESRKQNAERHKAQFAWNNQSVGNGNEGGVAGLLAKFNGMENQ